MARFGPSNDTAAVLRLEGVGFSYGRRAAVVQADLSFGQGVHAILGPNGAGKTTLLRILATAAAPDTGRVWIGGDDPWADGKLQSVRARIGYLPQKPGFYPRHSVVDFLELVTLLQAIPHRKARGAEITRVLEVVGLEQRARQKIGDLSGGMRQRLGLACALVGNPPVVIMDEPTVGLDPKQRSMFRELVSGIGTDHAVVISTHQTEDVSALCRTVHVIVEGRVVYQGATADLVDRGRGRVWESDTKEGQLSSWLSGSGRWRNLGSPSPAAVLLEPTVEDGYLVTLAEAQQLRTSAHGE